MDALGVRDEVDVGIDAPGPLDDVVVLRLGHAGREPLIAQRREPLVGRVGARPRGLEQAQQVLGAVVRVEAVVEQRRQHERGFAERLQDVVLDRCGVGVGHHERTFASSATKASARREPAGRQSSHIPR